MKKLGVLFFGLTSTIVRAQYAPQAGQPGSTAIDGSSSAFIAWATDCSVRRGYLDIAQPSLGYASYGDSSLATGPADGTLVSLGDSGVAVFRFANPIFDGPGADFAIFENGFLDAADPNLAYLELGFVEVSSDGINYFRFPANSLTADSVQIGNPDYLDARKLNNLAGKYIGGYGTPFDLQELSGIVGLDINNITHVRVIDVIGSVGAHGSLDSAGRKINDPYPTPFASCGFDLDAVGVMHTAGSAGLSSFENSIDISIYPNPVIDVVKINFKRGVKGALAVLSDISGKVLMRQELHGTPNELRIGAYQTGMYYLTINDASGDRWVKKITKL